MHEKYAKNVRDVLGIDDEKPAIKSVRLENQDKRGDYNDFENIIQLNEPAIYKYAKELVGDSNSINLGESITRIMVISHETWHAFQHNGNIPEERKKLYNINWNGYTQKSEYYSSQLAEKEAYMFSESLIDDIILKLNSTQES